VKSDGPTGPDREPAEIDTSVAHAARIYDYLLGGKANFSVDRAAAERAYAAWPGGLDGVRADARAHRAVLGRIVRTSRGTRGSDSSSTSAPASPRKETCTRSRSGKRRNPASCT
jgi:S-adenosyl methyltransferase